MTVEAVDRILTEWDERLRRVDESLLALEAEPTYQMLAPSAQTRTPLEGETKRIVEPALDALRELFEQRGRLTEVLERAKEVRASMSAFWGSEDKERQIRDLLSGPSIELAQETTPLARRALLDPGARDVRVMPEQLLAAMAGAYEHARDALLAVRQAWDASEPALEAIARTLLDARQTAESLGLEAAVADELHALEQELEAIRVRLATDPLGTSADLGTRLPPRAAAVKARMGGLVALRDRVSEGTRQAHTLLDEVRRTRTDAVRAVDRMPHEVEGAAASRLPTDEGLVEGLAPWLEKIEVAAAAGRWPTAETGLRKWTEAAQAYLAGDGEITRAFDALLARRAELSGRLSARRAQAAAMQARGGVIEPGAEEAAREAETLLRQRPTPLAKAKQAVEKFESLVKR